MPTSVPMMPAAGELHTENLLYLIQGTALDRDRKLTLAALREYCTAQGVSLYELNTSSAVSGVLTLALGAASTSAFVAVSGTPRKEVSGTLRNHFTLKISGSVPAGCQLTVVDAASVFLKIASSDATINGIDASLELTAGDSALLGRGTGTVWWGSATRSAAAVGAAVAAEKTRAEEEETSLSQAITAEATAREAETTRAEAAESALSEAVSDETARATAAEEAIGTRIDNLPSGAVKVVTASLGFNDSHVTLSQNVATTILSISVPAGSWMIDGVVNFQGGANIGSTMPACAVLRAWVGDSGAGPNSDNMAVSSTPENTGLGFGSATVPRKTFVLTQQTTIYLKAHCSDAPTNGTLSAFGRITATSAPSFE